MNESDTGIIAGIVVGCVAALFILSVVVGFIRHRRNRNVHESVGSSSRGDTTSFGWLLRSTQRKLFQGPRFGSADEVVALTTYSPRAPSVTPTESSYTPSLLPPPTGLSDKELARMRAESLVPRPTSAYMGSSGFHFDDVPVATINSEKVATIPPSDNQGL